MCAENQYIHSQSKSAEYLEIARSAMESRDFTTALKNYKKAKKQNTKDLEAWIGIAICLIESGKQDDAIKILKSANGLFGDHEAILGLITTQKLRQKSWNDTKTYWKRKESFLEYPTTDFYQATGEIFVELATSKVTDEDFTYLLLAELIFQDDRSVDEISHPVLCSLLFHHHEYNRPRYSILLERINLFWANHKFTSEPGLCATTTLLTFKSMSKNERFSLLKSHFHELRLYSHWSFILIASCLNDIWDRSLKNTLDNIPIVQEIVKEETRKADELDSHKKHKMLLLASICCQDTITLATQIDNIIAGVDNSLESKIDDLRFIKGKFNKPIKSIQSTVKQKLKIAFCVSGQLRGWKEALKSWQNIGLENCDVTYILHTWKDSGGGAPIPPKDERTLPASFQKNFAALGMKLDKRKCLSVIQNYFRYGPTTL